MTKRALILILSIICLLTGLKGEAQSQYSSLISKMETSLFGMEYNTQSDEMRLKRIEENVYGKASSSSINQRVNKLSTDLSVDVIDQQIKPKKDTFAEDDDDYKEPVEKADSSVNYPIINELEKKVFNKEFKTVDLNKRLSNLEQNVFKKNYNDDFNSRVDRLKTAVMPQKMANLNDNSDDTENDNIYRSDDIMEQKPLPNSNFSEDDDLLSDPLSQNNYQTPSYNSQNSVLDNYQQNADITVALSTMEKKVLKKSFPNDLVPNRLTRLELMMFHSTFVDDNEQTRIDRILSAYQAQKTAKKYDGNKFAQHMSAAMQVGAILLMILAAVL